MECIAMDQRFRRGFTAAEKTALWDRWQRGESLKAIGAFSVGSESIFRDGFGIEPEGRFSASVIMILSCASASWPIPSGVLSAKLIAEKTVD